MYTRSAQCPLHVATQYPAQGLLPRRRAAIQIPGRVQVTVANQLDHRLALLRRKFKRRLFDRGAPKAESTVQ